MMVFNRPGNANELIKHFKLSLESYRTAATTTRGLYVLCRMVRRNSVFNYSIEWPDVEWSGCAFNFIYILFFFELKWKWKMNKLIGLTIILWHCCCSKFFLLYFVESLKSVYVTVRRFDGWVPTTDTPEFSSFPHFAQIFNFYLF